MTENAGLSSIEAYDDLREAVGEPTASIAEKEMPMLDKHARHFLSLSPDPVHFDGRRGRPGRHQPARRSGGLRQGDRRPHDPDPRAPRQPARRHDVQHRGEPGALGRADIPASRRRGDAPRLRAGRGSSTIRRRSRTWPSAARSRSWGFWSRSTRCSSTAPRRSSAPGCGIPIRGSNERNFRRSPRSPGISGNTTRRWRDRGTDPGELRDAAVLIRSDVDPSIRRLRRLLRVRNYYLVCSPHPE